MATSGSADFTRTRNQICEAAARKIGAIRAGSTMSAQMLSDFAEALNGMVKHWQAKPGGPRIWCVSEATLFMQTDQVRYVLGATDHATESYVETTLSADEASGQTVLSVTSDDGISASDNIGIELDDGTMQWTTVSGAPSSDTVTVATALTGAAASGNRVIAYTTRILRPLKIVSARRYNFDSDTETEISLIARLDYQRLPNKTTEGTVTQAFYDPRGGANATGLFYVWPEPANIDDAIKFTYWRPIQDFDAAGDNPDLPTEWIQTLIFNLALVMAPEFTVPDATFSRVASMAAQYLDDMTGWDREEESVCFGPDMGA